MRPSLVTALTMWGFAAGPILNRLVIHGGRIGPMEFAAVAQLTGPATATADAMAPLG